MRLCIIKVNIFTSPFPITNRWLTTEVFDFDFVKNCEKKTKKVPKLVITWEDETPRTAMSTDGYVLAMYIPKAVCEKGQVLPQFRLASDGLTHIPISGSYLCPSLRVC
jgi:hypothetical protein